jgi:hypothetical protein
MGAEDIDFQGPGSNPPSYAPGTIGSSRSGWARSNTAALSFPAGSPSKSNPFTGTLTGWLSFRCYAYGNGMAVSFGRSGTNCGFGVQTNGSNQTQLVKYNGSSVTVLATDTTSGLTIGGGLFWPVWIDVQDFGSEATVLVYIQNTLVISGTFDLTQTGMTDYFDSVFGGGGGGGEMWCSEIFATIEDPRSYPGLKTDLATATGTVSQWSGNVPANITLQTYSEAAPEYDSVNEQEQDYTLTAPPAGPLSVVARKRVAFATVSEGSPVSRFALGWRNGSHGVGYGSGAVKTPVAGVWATYEQIDNIDPTTGVAFAFGDMSGIQSAIEALT